MSDFRLRLTVVFSYPDESEVPRIGPDTLHYEGANIMACQFSDALQEIECLQKTIENLRRREV